MFFPFLVALFACAPALLASPVRVARSTSESWAVSDLRTHFMGANSGLPGGAWPPGSAFNSSVDFTLQTDSTGDESRVCSVSWTPPDYPTGFTPCAAASSASAPPDVSFRLKGLPDRPFSETAFWLDVVRTEIDTCVPSTSFLCFCSLHRCHGRATSNGTGC